MIAIVVLLLLSFTYGAPLIVVVALKPIAATLDVPRAIPSLAAGLVWFGTGSGGILMGLLADRIGIRWTVLGGTVVMGLGLLMSSLGSAWSLLLGHGLLIGFLGSAAHLSAAAGLCQPVVRQAARHRVGADIVRAVHLRRDLAAVVSDRD